MTFFCVCEADRACAQPRSPDYIQELERCFKKALEDYGFPCAVCERFSLTGSVAITGPTPCSKAAKGLSEKYLSAVTCDIVVRDRTIHKKIVSLSGSFSDIGRSRHSARTFALGKLVACLLGLIGDMTCPSTWNSTDIFSGDIEGKLSFIQSSSDKLAGSIHAFNNEKLFTR